VAATGAFGDVHTAAGGRDRRREAGGEELNRRQFVAGLGATTALAAGYAGVRIGDVRPYSPSYPTGETPRERIVAAAAHRFAVDHRALTTVEIRRDWTDRAPYELGRHQQWHEHSRRRHLHALTTLDAPLLESAPAEAAPDLEYLSPHGTLPALLHYGRAFGAESLPLTYVLYVTDGTILYDFDAPTPSEDASAGDVRITDESGRSGVGLNHDGSDPLLQEYVRPHRSTWARVSDEERVCDEKRVCDDETTVTFRIDTPDAYSEVVPLALTGVTGLEDPFVEVTLDRDTGRLRTVVDHRDVVVDVWPDDADETFRTTGSRDDSSDGRRITYRITTVFDQYGDASAPRPAGGVRGEFRTRAKGLLSDVLRY
jgi:hypothetical protein